MKVLTFEELIKLTNVEMVNDNTMFRAPGITLKDTILQAVITSSGSFFCRYGDEKTDYSMVPLGRSHVVGFVPIKVAKGKYAYILKDRKSKNPILVYYGENNATVIGEACITQTEKGRISVFALHDKYRTIAFSSSDDCVKSVSIRISKTMPGSNAYLVASSVSCQEFSRPLLTDYDKGVLWGFVQKDRSFSEGISPVYTPILFFSGSNCIDICTLKPSNKYKDFFANLVEQKSNEYEYDPERIGFIKPETYCMCYERAIISDKTKRRKVSNEEVTNVLKTLNQFLSTDDLKKLLKHKSILFGSLYNRIIMRF